MQPALMWAMLAVFRGSVTFRDWIRDMLAVANPFVHAKLGPVHAPFSQLKV
jgi:hypothetical protein